MKKWIKQSRAAQRETAVRFPSVSILKLFMTVVLTKHKSASYYCNHDNDSDETDVKNILYVTRLQPFVPQPSKLGVTLSRSSSSPDSRMNLCSVYLWMNAFRASVSPDGVVTGGGVRSRKAGFYKHR